MKYDNLIFDQLIKEGLIPLEGCFEVTEDIKEHYTILYSFFSGEGNIGTKSNKKYAKKLAGLSLLKLNKNRVDNKSFNKLSSGIVYLITNPAFPGYVKVGITKDLKKRLAAYQTYDPLRRYKVDHYQLISNARLFERYVLTHKSVNLAKGEWLKYTEEVKELFLNSSVGRTTDC